MVQVWAETARERLQLCSIEEDMFCPTLSHVYVFFPVSSPLTLLHASILIAILPTFQSLVSRFKLGLPTILVSCIAS